MRASLSALLLAAACGSNVASVVPRPDSGHPPPPLPRDASIEDAGEIVPPEPDAGPELVPPSGLGPRLDLDAGQLSLKVFSAHATRIAVELYREPLRGPVVFTAPLDDDGSGTFSLKVPLSQISGLGPLFYGYRAWGPNWPYDPAFKPGTSTGFLSDVDAAGNRFNPNKLLFDPYALELSHDPRTPSSLDGSAYNSGAQRGLDSGPIAPKGVVLAPAAAELGERPTRPLTEEIIYEVQLRGLTANDMALSPEQRGTYAGAAQHAMALKALGITTIEFLPLQETQNDTNDVSPNDDNGDNYWGYSTLSYFAPDRRFASDKSPGGPTREVQAMVRAFHDAGIKVFADVVYNHTGEGGLMTFRGLDNSTYYSLSADRQGYQNNNGVGPNFNTRNAAAQALIIDSLKYWHEVLGFDGFRFDLAPVLGNTCEHGCFRYSRDDPHTALNHIVMALPGRPAAGGNGVDLVAEPWASAADGYQLGNFPKGWAEWNGQFRDTVRSVQNKMGVEPTTLQTLVTRLTGSGDLYNDDGRGLSGTVNYVVSHDGFTMKDLYSCNVKNNGQPWPYGPSGGGGDDDKGWDQGGVAGEQRRGVRTGLALMALSAGSIMVTGGDEQLRTLQCNNNAYNLDSPANWLQTPSSTPELNHRVFVSRLFAFRKAHPSLRPQVGWRADDGNGNGLEQLKWFQPSRAVADAAYLGDVANHALAWRLDATELGEAGAIYVAYNGWSQDVAFTLPTAPPNQRWLLVGDTCSASEGPDQLAAPGTEREVGMAGAVITVCARGLALLVSR
jgi:glycogen operon protein